MIEFDLCLKDSDYKSLYFFTSESYLCYYETFFYFEKSNYIPYYEIFYVFYAGSVLYLEIKLKELSS